MQNKGCITCRKCEQVRLSFFCGRKKLTQKQLYNQYGFCTRYEPRPAKPQTEEEWLHTLNTEQLAEWIAHQTMIALLENQNNHSLRMTYPAYWVEWLKQPHREE